MGMKFASKLIGALVVKSQLFKSAKGVLSVAGPTNTKRMVWRVTTLALMSLLSARAASLHEVGGAVSRGWLVGSSVLGRVCCVTHGVSKWKKEKKEWVWLYRE
eukprot:200951-Pelagomonas_calceolata.AAC.1